MIKLAELKELARLEKPFGNHLFDHETVLKLINEIELLRESLKSICEEKCAIGINPCEARQALDESKERMGE